MGAIASGGIRVLHDEVIGRLGCPTRSLRSWRHTSRRSCSGVSERTAATIFCCLLKIGSSCWWTTDWPPAPPKRLINEKGFAAVAAEADWPDAYRVHRYVSGGASIGRPTKRSGTSSDFQRGCGAISRILSATSRSPSMRGAWFSSPMAAAAAGIVLAIAMTTAGSLCDALGRSVDTRRRTD
ncbi:MAG: Protein-L-isoaspartate O-methyltransferase [Nitrospira sp.]|nr:MAG: Protein-L-isoaspartate O-methyltransferase [Nitrospira sp.]